MEPVPESPPPTPGAGPRGPSPSGDLQAVAADPRFAGFWVRVCAYVLDYILLSMIVWLILAVAVTGYSLGAFGHFSAKHIVSTSLAPWPSMAGMELIVLLAYFTLFLGRSGQTPGKKFFGIRVVRTDGGPVTYGQALLRTIGYYINMLTLGIGFLWVAMDRRKQGLHDKIAGTLELRLTPVP